MTDQLVQGAAICQPPAPTTHRRLAPSGCSRWLPCPYSARTDLPQFDSASADQGTDAHGWGANALERNCTLDDVPPEFRSGVTMYVEHVLDNHVQPIVERAWDSLSIPEHGGTIDCLLIQDRTAVIYDFKFGKWAVKAEGNPQLLCYAEIVADHFEIDTYYGVIVQPNSSGKQKIKTAEYTLDEVNLHRERVAQAAVSDEKNTGWHCLWCPLLRAKMCDEGREYARRAGWDEKYKHLRGV